MRQNGTLLGVMVGAAIVGTTLLLREMVSDPRTAANVRTKARAGYEKIKSKVGEGCSFVQGKVQEGCGAAREKAGEAKETLRHAVENAPAVQKLKQKVKEIHHVAEPSEAMFADTEEEEETNGGHDNDAETVVEVEAGIREPEEGQE